MAHPGLALFGAIALGLIGAGVWLRIEAARPEPPPLPPPADEAAAAEARAAATEAQAPEAEPGTVAPDPAPTPAPEPPPDPAPRTGERPAEAQDPGPGAPPAPGPAAGKPALDPPPAAEAEVAAQPAPPGFAPVTYSGAPELREQLPPGLHPAEEERLRAFARSALGEGAYFGAAAAAPRREARGAATGFGALAAAEAAALAERGRNAPNCVVIAHLVPADFDGRMQGTLSARQAALWAEFQTAPILGAMHRAFAVSDRGAAWRDMTDPQAAASLAVTGCRLSGGAAGRRPFAPPDDCRVVATRSARD